MDSDLTKNGLKKKPKFAGIFVEKSMEGSSVTVVD
jgi:hypothetical protein